MKNKQKTAKYRASPKKMAAPATQKEEKVRLVIDCTSKERKKIKMFANYHDKTIREFVLDCIRYEMRKSYIPNEETKKSLEESSRREGVKSFESMDDLFEDLGL